MIRPCISVRIFLEHSHVLQFHHWGEDRMFISTADWMPRNLDKRIELLVPVEDTDGKRRLIEILDKCLKDTTNSWKLLPDGQYQRIRFDGKKKPLRCQEEFYRRACEASADAEKARRTVFEPHIPAQGVAGAGTSSAPAA